MNKTYRSVWNHALGACVAVSELAAARGKRPGGLGSVVVAAGMSVLAASGTAQTIDYADGSTQAGAIDTTPSDITLNSLGAGTATQSGLISGANGIVKTGAGIIVLSASNTYQGSTTINAGALQVSSDANLGSGGAIAFNGGTLRLGADNFSSGRAIVLGAGGGTVDVAGTKANTLSGQISGSGTLTLRNTGSNTLGSEDRRLTIDNTGNNYTGGTVLQGNGTAGRLNVWTTTAGSFGSGPVTIRENAELRFDGAGASAGNLDIRVAANTNVNGTNSGLQFQFGATAGTSTLTTGGAGSYVLFGSGASASQATIRNEGGRVIFQVNSSGGNATIHNNGGSVLLQNTPDLSGATIVNNNDVAHGTGRVYVQDVAAPVSVGSLSGAGDVVLGNSTLVLGARGMNDTISGVIANTGPGLQDINGAFYVNPVMLGNGAVVKVGTGTLTLTGNNTYTNGTTINGGALQLGNGGTSGSVQGNIAIGSGASLIVNRSDNYTLANAVSGSGMLTQAGTGTTTLTGTNTYSGGTRVAGGVLQVDGDARLGLSSGGIALDGGTLRATGMISSTRSIAVGSGGGTIDVNGQLFGAAGKISGAGTLTIASTQGGGT